MRVHAPSVTLEQGRTRGHIGGKMLPYSTLPGGIPGIGQPGPRSFVELLQRVLRREGVYGGPVNGGSTADTGTAVKSFQAARGLTADGVVGPATWEALPAEDLRHTHHQ
ncbi:peptidoglycan-binding domain-containing protein [Streptomyces sp. BE147]|uniref:peptidoglycan-binding domain-containing protein n=1 Tax=Streptomyces sp. BE147 TaxID=3002524 RepID=UPI002E766EF8|nr:peptidoglycan-binding domain-containing protein [Streptomyces sp. BE147]